MKDNKETIIQKAYELLKTVIPILNKFPRSQRYALGDRLQNQLSDLLESYIQAFYAPVPQKKPMLNQINIQIEILRHYFRLAYDLGLYPSTRYKEFAEKLHEIGRMTGGWLKSLEK